MDSEDLRLAVYRAFAGTGRAPGAGGLAAQLGAEASEVVAGPHAWSLGRRRPPDGGQVAHFLVPAARMWDDVVHTCAHQRLFCSEDCVAAWLAATGSARGVPAQRRAVRAVLGPMTAGVGRMCREASPASCPFRRVGLRQNHGYVTSPWS